MAKAWEGNVSFNLETGNLVSNSKGNWNASNVMDFIKVLAERNAKVSNWHLWATIDGEAVLERGGKTKGSELLALASREDAKVALIKTTGGSRKSGRTWPKPTIRIEIGEGASPAETAPEKPSNLI
jgi:hypothetical protein